MEIHMFSVCTVSKLEAGVRTKCELAFYRLWLTFLVTTIPFLEPL